MSHQHCDQSGLCSLRANGRSKYQQSSAVYVSTFSYSFVIASLISALSYHFLWAPTCQHFRMISWVSFSLWHLGHLWDSTASGNIFDFAYQCWVIHGCSLGSWFASEVQVTDILTSFLSSQCSAMWHYSNCVYPEDTFNACSLGYAFGSGGICTMWSSPLWPRFQLPSNP